MENQGLWDEGKESDARSQIRRDVLKAFADAEKEKKPSLEDMFTDVYEDLSEESKDHMQELGRLLDEYPEEYDVSEFEGGRKGLGKGIDKRETE